MSGINPQYIKGFAFQDSFDDDEYRSPLLKGIRNLLQTCGMHRVFTEEDMKVFLSRLVILHRRENAVVELEELADPMNYAFDYDKSKVRLGDIFRHYGIEIFDYTNHFINDEGFRYKLALAWSGGFSSNRRYELAIPSDQLMEEAKNFAEMALKVAPSELFAVQERFRGKMEEILLRKEVIDRIPEFDLEKIPVQIRNQCMEIMFPDEWYKETIEEARDEPEYYEPFYEEEEKYIYLAWLYANELICYDMGMAFPVEGVDLDIDKYSINHPELGPLGMEFTIEEFNIPDTETLLKG